MGPLATKMWPQKKQVCVQTRAPLEVSDKHGQADVFGGFVFLSECGGAEVGEGGRISNLVSLENEPRLCATVELA